MKVNVVVMNHVALELIALLLLKLKKYYLSVFVFYCLEVWKDVGIETIGVLRCLGLVAVITICLSLIWYWLRRF